jgi:hypothetical protein
MQHNDADRKKRMDRGFIFFLVVFVLLGNFISKGIRRQHVHHQQSDHVEFEILVPDPPPDPDDPKKSPVAMAILPDRRYLLVALPECQFPWS